MARTKEQARRMVHPPAPRRGEDPFNPPAPNPTPPPSPPPLPPPSPPPVRNPTPPPSPPPSRNPTPPPSPSRENASEENSSETDKSQSKETSNTEGSSNTEESKDESGSSSEEEVTGSDDANVTGMGVMPPVGFYIEKDQYPRTIKIATRCYIAKAVKEIKKRLNANEKEWFLNHPQFQHFFHMPEDKNHKSMGMWMLILRMARIEKKKELWFVVNGVPIRYSMREHALISGLFCHEYPRNYKEMGNLQFVEKHFKNEDKVTQEMVEDKFLSMRTPTNDRLKMAVLYFLTQVIKGNAKRGDDAPGIDPFLKRIVTDLDMCRDFPWGRFTFFDNLNEVDRMVSLFKGGIVNKACNLPSFIVPLELLAFETIPCLGNSFRMSVDGANKRCPRMCKGKFKSWSLRGFPIEEIYQKLGETIEIDSIIEATREERHLISDMEEEDDVVDAVVDGWNHRLLVEKQPLYFEDLMNEDIKMRTVEKEEEEEEPRVGETSEAASGGVIGGNDLKELQDLMVAGFKQMNEKLDSVTQRLNAVEVFVSEVRNTGDPRRSVRSDVGVGRGASDGVDLLANAARAVVGEHDQEKEKELEDEEGREVEMGEDQATEGQENVQEEEQGREVEMGEEQATEKDDAQVGETQEKDGETEAKEADETLGSFLETVKRRRRSYSEYNKPPYSKPNTRQRTKK